MPNAATSKKTTLSATSSIFSIGRDPNMQGFIFHTLLFSSQFRCLKYPQCLYFLDAVQNASFREALASGANAKFIEDQQILQWHYYLRKAERLKVGHYRSRLRARVANRSTDLQTTVQLSGERKGAVRSCERRTGYESQARRYGS